MDKKTIARRLRELRGSRTAKELADELGISRSAVAMYERGARVPSDEVKIRYAEVFGVSVESIFYAR